MKSQCSLQTIAIRILSNISQSKDIQTMKFAQFFFFTNYAENEVSFYFLKKLNTRQKQVVCGLVSVYFDSPQLAIQEKQTG